MENRKTMHSSLPRWYVPVGKSAVSNCRRTVLNMDEITSLALKERLDKWPGLVLPGSKTAPSW